MIQRVACNNICHHHSTTFVILEVLSDSSKQSRKTEVAWLDCSCFFMLIWNQCKQTVCNTIYITSYDIYKSTGCMQSIFLHSSTKSKGKPHIVFVEFVCEKRLIRWLDCILYTLHSFYIIGTAYTQWHINHLPPPSPLFLPSVRLDGGQFTWTDSKMNP